ncbi:MAG TPA: hypothetical protein VH593_26245 [Ktedonobacteraceae bacterium]
MSRVPSKGFVRGILIGGLLLVLIAGVLVTSVLLITRSQAAAKMVTPRDSHIKYIGRWDTSNSTVFTSYWPGAYLETDFTGTTIKAKVAGPSALYVSIDHKPDVRISSISSSGLVNLTPTPLKSGTHTLRIAVADDTDTLQFEGLILDRGATVVAPHISSKLIEFIGGSVTVGKLIRTLPFLITPGLRLNDLGWNIPRSRRMGYVWLTMCNVARPIPLV